MERSSPIVYLATENNMKSCLGLEAIVKDGWNVRLVVAYEPPVSGMAPKGVKGRASSYLRKRYPHLHDLIRRRFRKTKHGFSNMKFICDTCHIPYRATSETSLTGLKDDISRISPDVILSNGWQFKIKEDIFSLARLMALNCHSSFLPEYRGGNITYAPLINEEKESGVTVHELIDKFDAGMILAQARVPIESGESPWSLNAKRARITGKVLIAALEIAGHPECYKPNPPSPFYFRCSNATYKRYKRINFLRKCIGLPIKRYEPKEPYDI